MASPFVQRAQMQLLPVADLTGAVTLTVVDKHDAWCECWLCAEADFERFSASHNELTVES